MHTSHFGSAPVIALDAAGGSGLHLPVVCSHLPSSFRGTAAMNTCRYVAGIGWV